MFFIKVTICTKITCPENLFPNEIYLEIIFNESSVVDLVFTITTAIVIEEDEHVLVKLFFVSFSFYAIDTKVALHWWEEFTRNSKKKKKKKKKKHLACLPFEFNKN